MQKKDRAGGGVSISSGRDTHIGGDVVAGDKITGGLSEAQALTRIFDDIRQCIDKRPDDPNVDKDELTDTVTKLEKEVAKGPAANGEKVKRWLTFLASMADDIFEVTVSSLTSPVLGISKAIQLIAKKARDEYSKQPSS